ncbi:MAG: MarR family transcriptional regulator [Cyclobacteriaceae bacterium]|jgi:DNA-binding MarR family transcriptional regulator|nr:MarR family transcriptional regulator [Cyclobacteriaceae bacterium]
MTIEEEIKQQKFRTPQQKAILNILFTANWIQNKQKEFFEPHGITGQQYNILRILRGKHPNQISAAEIKTRMLDKNSDVSRLIDRLILKELVVKTQCPKDKRAFDIIISETGLELLRKLDTTINKLDHQVIGLSNDDAIILSDMLDKGRS